MFPGVSAEYELPKTCDVRAVCTDPSDTEAIVNKVLLDMTAKFCVK